MPIKQDLPPLDEIQEGKICLPDDEPLLLKVTMLVIIPILFLVAIFLPFILPN